MNVRRAGSIIIMVVLLCLAKGYGDTPFTAGCGAAASSYPDIEFRGSTMYVAWNDSGTARFNRSTDGGRTWGTPVKVSTSVAGDPAIALDGAGRVYIVLSRGGNVYCLRSVDGGASFASERLVSPGVLEFPDIAIRNDRIYVTTQDQFSIYFSSTTAATYGFGASKRVAVGGNYYPRKRSFIAASDSGRNVYITFKGDFDAGGHKVFFVRSTNYGGSFSSPLALNSAYGAYRQHIAAAYETYVYISYWDDTGSGTGRLLFCRSVNSGATFGAITAIEDAGLNGGDWTENSRTFDQRTSLAAAGSRVLLAWDLHASSGAACTGTRYCISSNVGSNWTQNACLSSDAGEPCVALNERGEGALVYTQFNGTDYSVRVASAPPAITDFSAASGDSGGQLNVSWTVPDFAVSGYDLRCSTSPIDETSFYASSAVSGPPAIYAPNTSVGPWPVTGFAVKKTYYLAVKSRNGLGQYSSISNVSSAVSYNIDVASPCAVTDLAVESLPFAFRLSWTAPGDNGEFFDLAPPPDGGYVVKYAPVPLLTEDDFANAAEYPQTWAPLPAGSREVRYLTGFTAGQQYYFAVRAYDSVYNRSKVSNGASGTFITLSLADASPRALPNRGSVSLTLCGRGLGGGMTAALKRAGQQDITAFSVDCSSPSRAVCGFVLSGIEPGAWDIEITRDGQSARLPGALYVHVPDPPDAAAAWEKRSIGYYPRTLDVTAADIDRDGKPEIYTVDESCVYRTKGDGVRWTKTLLFNEGSGRVNAAAAGDADNDGRPELYAAGAGCVYQYPYRGGAWGRYVLADGMRSVRNPVIADADNDGCRELYLFDAGKVCRLSGIFAGQCTRSYLPIPPGVSGWTSDACFAAGDADNDGGIELYIGDTSGVYRAAYDGSWSVARIDTRVSGDVFVADGNNDGNNELYVSAGFGYPGVWQYSFDGTSWTSTKITASSRLCGVGMDADNDGRNEVCGLELPLKASRFDGTAWTTELIDGTADLTRLAVCGGFNDGYLALYAFSGGNAALYEFRKRKLPGGSCCRARPVYNDNGAGGTIGCYDDRSWGKNSTVSLYTDYATSSEGTYCLKVRFDVADQGYAGTFVAAPGTENLYPYYYAGGALRFSIRFSSTPPADLSVGIRSQNVGADSARSNVALSRYLVHFDSGAWQDVTIPLADLIAAEPFTDFNQMKVLFNLAYVASSCGGPYRGDVWVDNVQWLLPDRLDYIRIVPGAATVGPGGRRTFSALFFNGSGETVVPSAAPEWSLAGGGSLDPERGGVTTFTASPDASDGSSSFVVCRLGGVMSSSLVTVSTRTWSRSYAVYSDSGLPYGSDINVWESDGLFDLAETREADAPGGACIRQVVDSVYGGWGVAYSMDVLGGTRDLSGYSGGVLSFRVKTPAPLRIEMQGGGPDGPKKAADISGYGWDGTNNWQEIAIPVADFISGPGIDITKVHAPFLVTVTTPCCFCVGSVRLVTCVANRGPREVRITGGQLFVDNEPFVVRGVCDPAVPPGGDRTYDWSTDRECYGADIPLLKAMGANVIRLYKPPSNKEALKDFADRKIYCIMTYPVSASDVAAPENVKAGFLNMVRTFMDSPGVLAWCIGNEVDRELSGGDLAAWYRLVEECARAAHETESCAGITPHPVTTANADLGAIGDPGSSADDASLSDLDFWSVQAYRGPGFGTLFDDFGSRSRKPLLLGEFGCDAWNGTAGAEDEETQSRYLLAQWEEIRSRLRTNACPQGILLGGCVFQWCDCWCKSFANTEGNAGHDTSCDWTNPAYADPAMNEEWWGICSVSSATGTGRRPRKAYYALGSAWNQAPLLKAGIYAIADDSPAGTISWDVRGVPDGWRIAQQYLKIDCSADFDGWGIQAYTDNCAEDACPRFSTSAPACLNPAGLVRCSDRKKSLPMCWRATDAPVSDPREFEIRERYDGTRGKLFAPVLGDRYACYLWMKDRGTPALPGQNTAAFVDGEEYVTVWDSSRGIHHGENEWSPGPSSPNYLYFGARFTGAVTPDVYRTGKLIVELFVE